MSHAVAYPRSQARMALARTKFEESREVIGGRIFKLYLAGAIAGLTIAESEAWREEIKALLPPQIVPYGPLRGKADALRTMHEIPVRPLDHHHLVRDRSIMARDHYDVCSSDLVICNLLGARRVSIGSCMEIAWAFDRQIPLVLIMEEEGNLHDHPMVREAYAYLTSTIADAARITCAVLLP